MTDSAGRPIYVVKRHSSICRSNMKIKANSGRMVSSDVTEY